MEDIHSFELCLDVCLVIWSKEEITQDFFTSELALVLFILNSKILHQALKSSFPLNSVLMFPVFLFF